MSPALLARAAALVALAAAGCTDRPAARPTPADATDSTPTDAAARSCARDADCTDGWHPQMPSCGPVERCFEDRCVTPPAMTGAANAETGALVFETDRGERRYDLEIVDAPFEITRGMMCRRSMAADWGMLFLMETTKVQRFWMMNTLIPLDMVFIDEQWTVVGVVESAEPQTTTPRSVEAPSRYVLELAGGEAARAGVAVGTRARFYAPRAAQ